MPVTTAYSTKPLHKAVAELKRGCGDSEPRVVICFASAHYDLATFCSQLRAAFPDACTVGCSTAGEIADNKMMTRSVVAMFLDKTIVEDAVATVTENLHDGVDVSPAFAQFERHFGASISSLALGKHVGMVLVDGLSGAEERLMDKIGNQTDLLFVGGSAGDDLRFRRTEVFANGRAYTDAAVLVLLCLRNGYDVIKTQSFKTSGRRLVATKVDEARRKVIEFDGKPAAEAYAHALNVAPHKISAEFMRHPLGLMINGEPFVRSPQHAEGHNIVFYCNVKQGMELEILNASDIVADTQAAIEEKKFSLKHVEGLIDFQCILRALELRDKKQCDQYGAIFAGIPTIGFSTYGEQLLGHINQTSTMLVFR